MPALQICTTFLKASLLFVDYNLPGINEDPFSRIRVPPVMGPRLGEMREITGGWKAEYK